MQLCHLQESWCTVLDLIETTEARGLPTYSMFSLHVQRGSRFLGTFDFSSPSFDWGDDYSHPNIPFHDLIIYELPVRTFTADPSCGLPEGEWGTFKGLMEKVWPGVKGCSSLSDIDTNEGHHSRNNHPSFNGMLGEIRGEDANSCCLEDHSSVGVRRSVVPRTSF